MQYLNRECLFYDIEIIENHFVLVLLKHDKSVEKIFIADGEPIEELEGRFDAAEWADKVTYDLADLSYYVDNYTLVGYNNYGFDDHLVTAILRGQTTTKILKFLANKVINQQRVKGKKTMYASDKIFSLDCIQQINVMPIGLKNIQANKGENIHEMNVAHDFAGVLTDDELIELTDYCINDVASTIDVFNERQVYFQNKVMLIKMGDQSIKPEKAIRWNSTTLSANLFGKIPESTIDFSYFSVPKDILDYWEKYWFAEKPPEAPEWTEFGNNMTFGFGGLHGTNPKCRREKDILHIDVASMYPNLIINLGILGEYTEMYKGMLAKRIELKHSKDPEDQAMQEALKLILNSIYGLLGNRYSKLYNFGGMRLVCFHGMNAIYNIAKGLSEYGTIVQVNTDGVYFKPHRDGWKEVVDEFEKVFNLDLDRDPYDEIIQRDVNNYIAIEKKGKDWSDSKIKVKGAFKTYSNNWYYANNSLSIIPLTVIEKLVFDKDILDNMLDRVGEPRLFQYIAKTGHTFEGVIEMNNSNVGYEYTANLKYNQKDPLLQPENVPGLGEIVDHTAGGNPIYNVIDVEAFNDYVTKNNLFTAKGTPKIRLNKKSVVKTSYEVLHTKYNRLFVTPTGIPFRKVKILEDGRIQLSQFPNLPDNTTIFNDDLSKFNQQIDVGYYYQLALQQYQEYIS